MAGKQFVIIVCVLCDVPDNEGHEYPILTDALHHIRQPFPGIEPEWMALELAKPVKGEEHQPPFLPLRESLSFIRRGELRSQGEYGLYSLLWRQFACHAPSTPLQRHGKRCWPWNPGHIP